MSLPALTVKILGDASSYQQALRDAQRQTSDFASTISSAMRTTGGVLSGVVTAPLTAIGGGGMGLANAVELEMSRVEGLVGIAGNIVAQWRDQLPSIGEAVGKSGLELSQALFYITSAGLRGQTAIDALTMSAKASVAGLGETLKVADAVTSAINAYQKTGMTAAMATDILTAAVREGKLEAASLAPIMGRVLPIASAMKVDFAEVAGAIAVMSRVGAKAAEGSVAIQAFLSGLMKPSKKGQAAMKGVGLEFEDLRNMVQKPGGLIAAMRLLDEKFGDNEEALAAVVPNIRSLRGVLNVLSQDAKIVDSVMGGVRNSVGDTDKAFEVSARTASVQLDIAMVRVRNTLSAVGRTVAEVLIPMIQKGSLFVTRLRDAWIALDPEVKRTVVQFGLLAAAVGPVLVVLGGLFPLLMTGVNLIVTPFVRLLTVLPTILGGITLLAAGYYFLSDGIVSVSAYLWEQIQAWSDILIVGGLVALAVVSIYSAMKILWSVLVTLKLVQAAQVALWTAQTAAVTTYYLAIGYLMVHVYALVALIKIYNAMAWTQMIVTKGLTIAFNFLRIATIANKVAALAVEAAYVAQLVIFGAAVVAYYTMSAAVSFLTVVWNAFSASQVGQLLIWIAVKIAVIAATVVVAVFNVVMAAASVAGATLSAVLLVLKIAVVALAAAVFLFISAAVVSFIIATANAAVALYSALTNVVSLSGPIAYIGSLFGEWWTILVKVFDLLKGGNMEGAWAVFSAGARLAIEQVKALWTPLWAFIGEGFGAIWDYVIAIWEAEFDLRVSKPLTLAARALETPNRLLGWSDRATEEEKTREALAKARKSAARSMLEARFGVSLGGATGPDTSGTGGGGDWGSADAGAGDWGGKPINVPGRITWNDPVDSQAVKDARKALNDLVGQIAMDDMLKGTWMDFDTWTKVGKASDMVGNQIEENISNPIATATKELQKFDAALYGSAEGMARLADYRARMTFVPPTSAVGKGDVFAPGIVGAGGGAPGIGVDGEAQPVLEQIRDLLKEKRKEVTILGAEIL